MPRKAKGRSGVAVGASRLLAEPPFQELARDQLSVFLYVALTPDETSAIVKELGLSLPGFRQEGLGEVQRCDLVADEIRADPRAAEPVRRALAAAFGEPPLSREALPPSLAGELVRLGASESAAALALWRVLSDRDAAVRRSALPTLDWLAVEYYGPRQGGEAAPPAAAASAAPDRDRKLEDLERALGQAREDVAEGRQRAEAQREKLQAQLKEARSREAQALDEAARARGAAEGSRRELERTQAALAALEATDAAEEAQRARALARDLTGRVGSLEAKLMRASEREQALEAALQAARPAAGSPQAPPPGEGEPEPDEALAIWLTPVYTQEFYDSLQGWDRRIQRAAFKQAHLLAQDHRHPSLRAIPLEGLPGFYRVRVATDVRLLYRRGERQNTVEILSLIDREDLDRYIRQAKTRG